MRKPLINLTLRWMRQNVFLPSAKLARKLGTNCSRCQRNDTLYILHDIIQITKSLKTSLPGTHLITEKYLTRNFIYNIWKSHQEHYFIMSSLSVVGRIIKSVLPKKWYNFHSWRGAAAPPPHPRLVHALKGKDVQWFLWFLWVRSESAIDFENLKMK